MPEQTYKIYTAKAGDTWDLIAFRAWEDEKLMHRLIAANPGLSIVVVFTGGERVRIPDIDEQLNTASLPPWRR